LQFSTTVLIYRGRSACCFALSARKTVNISTAGQSSSPFGKRVWGCEIPQKGSDFFFAKTRLFIANWAVRNFNGTNSYSKYPITRNPATNQTTVY
jgi:hypothetical protein